MQVDHTLTQRVLSEECSDDKCSQIITEKNNRCEKCLKYYCPKCDPTEEVEAHKLCFKCHKEREYCIYCETWRCRRCLDPRGKCTVCNEEQVTCKECMNHYCRPCDAVQFIRFCPDCKNKCKDWECNSSDYYGKCTNCLRDFCKEHTPPPTHCRCTKKPELTICRECAPSFYWRLNYHYHSVCKLHSIY